MGTEFDPFGDEEAVWDVEVDVDDDVDGELACNKKGAVKAADTTITAITKIATSLFPNIDCMSEVEEGVAIKG